tara:strand:- start:19385 stop:19525 length:141 start_codon:yes stop_codon:yes gene_type:complete
MISDIQMLEAKILDFYTKLSGEAKKEYAEYFGIVSSRAGTVKQKES